MWIKATKCFAVFLEFNLNITQKEQILLVTRYFFFILLVIFHSFRNNNFQPKFIELFLIIFGLSYQFNQINNFSILWNNQSQIIILGWKIYFSSFVQRRQCLFFLSNNGINISKIHILTFANLKILRELSSYTQILSLNVFLFTSRFQIFLFTFWPCS